MNYCPKCYRSFTGEHCDDCQMTIRECNIFNQGWDACLSYINGILPRFRIPINDKSRKVK